MSLTVGSLFSGIGGLDLGLERAGMEVRWQCEIYIRRMGDGLSIRLDRSRLFALGNAVVPQVAEFVGARLLEQIESAPQIRGRRA